jgi:hypothetical protein
MKTDPKYMGIPNICFSLTKKDDAREPELIEQRLTRGFDDSETWSLRDTIANFTIPRLERYIELAGEFLAEPELIEDAKKLLDALQLIARNDGICIFDEDEEKRVEEGLGVFPKVFMGLWW